MMLAALINGFVVSVPLAAVVWLVLSVSRRWVNAATRYAVWWILLALVVCLPFRYVPSRPAPRIAAAPARLPAAEIVQALSAPSLSIFVARVNAPRFPLRVAPGSWSAWIMAVWAIAAFVMLLRLFFSYKLLLKMKRQAVDAPELVAASARSALELFGVTRRIRVAIVNDAVSPMVAGPFRPTILLPAVMLESMEDGEIAQILLHEAAHLARRDDWALIVQRLIEVVFALHPLVRWIAAQINLEREIACDDLVISVTGAARPYAACLTRIAELAGGFSGSPAAAAVGEERSHLTRRVEMLLDKNRHAGARLLGARFAVLACGLALATLLAARTAGVVAFSASQRARVAQPAALALPAVKRELIAQARPAATRPPAAPSAPATQPVRITVSVTDPLNHFVTGLEADAFHVFENGVERKIVDFTSQKQPISIAIVRDEKSELGALRSRLAQLRAIYQPSFPEVRVAEAEISEIENRARSAPPVIDVPGSQVSVTEVGEGQSLADGLESALGQLRNTPAEQAAIMLVFGPASWADEEINSRIFALVRAARVPVYPVVAPDRAQARLAALATQLVNQYFIEYVPSGTAGAGELRGVDVRLTPPVGLPQLTARVSKP